MREKSRVRRWEESHTMINPSLCECHLHTLTHHQFWPDVQDARRNESVCREEARLRKTRAPASFLCFHLSFQCLLFKQHPQIAYHFSWSSFGLTNPCFSFWRPLNILLSSIMLIWLQTSYMLSSWDRIPENNVHERAVVWENCPVNPGFCVPR